MSGEDSGTVPGCLSFIVAEDAADSDVLWITEVWTSQAAHEASLQAPAIKPNLANADTLIAAFEKVAVTSPVAKSSHPLHGKVETARGPFTNQGAPHLRQQSTSDLIPPSR